jgi:hypothetical protein
MLLTLPGRMQTRIFSLLTIGSLLTLLVTPLLPISGHLADKYRTTFILLVSVVVLGLGWELIYHAIQQFRWEKDWPTPFGLVTGLNEGLLLWLLLSAGAIPGASAMSGTAFLIDFAVVWVGTWLWVSGPMRAPFIRWRFRGGRLV